MRSGLKAILSVSFTGALTSSLCRPSTTTSSSSCYAVYALRSEAPEILSVSKSAVRFDSRSSMLDSGFGSACALLDKYRALGTLMMGLIGLEGSIGAPFGSLKLLYLICESDNF